MEECLYFVSNVLVQIRHVFLLNYLLVLSLLKFRSVGIFWNKKKSNPNKGSFLNNSIDIYIYIYIFAAEFINFVYAFLQSSMDYILLMMLTLIYKFT